MKRTVPTANTTHRLTNDLAYRNHGPGHVVESLANLLRADEMSLHHAMLLRLEG